MSKLLLVIILIFLSGTILPFIYGAHVSFYLYEFIYFLNPGYRWWSGSIPSWPYSKITVIILLITFFINLKKYNKNKLSQIPQFKWFTLLILTYALVYLYALAPIHHWDAFINFLKLFLVIGVAYKVLDSQQKLEWALFAYILGCAYLGYETYTVGRNSGDRVEGIGLIDAPDSNGAAAVFSPVIPFLIFYFWLGNKKIKLAIVIAGAFIVNALILINSRGAFVGASAGTLLFIWEMFKSKIKMKHQKLIVVAFIVLGIMSLSVLVDDSFYNRMMTLTNVEDEQSSGSHRYHFWLVTFDMMKDYPYGVGAWGYETLSIDYIDKKLTKGGVKSVHSIWFQTLSEVGWHGFFFFIMIIFSTFKISKLTKIKCIENNNLYQYFLNHALLCAFVASLFAGSFLNQFRVQLMYWTILFIACFYSIIVVNSETKINKTISKFKS